MKVPYCLPLINQDVIDEVVDTLKVTGWLTTGPKVKAFEKELEQLCDVDKVLAVNSWNAGTTLMLRWWGIKPGDEVIIPAYTYSATALAVMNLGATAVMVDIKDDFNIDIDKIAEKITNKTKAIIPVDIGGMPCDYDKIKSLVSSQAIKDKFQPEGPNQEKLARLLILSDAAHSLGAELNGRMFGSLADISVFSFHSVKNVTTGEGGAVALNLPEPFNNTEVYNYLKHFHLYGQTKSALDKTTGKWRYDIVSKGMKANMNDVCASIGLSQVRRYKDQLLVDRIKKFEYYNDKLSGFHWAKLPELQTGNKKSSAHLYMLRIKECDEERRDGIISILNEMDVGVSVHYIPMATLTFFKTEGYQISDYPQTYENYKAEISLPLYNDLSFEHIDYVIECLEKAYNKTTS